MSVSEPQSESPPRKRCWLQYRLRTLLVLMVLVAVGMSYVAVTIREARRQKQVAEALEKAGATVATEPIWLGRVLGDDSLMKVVDIDAGHSQVTDAVLVQVEELVQLEELDLMDTSITDAGLVRLKGLSRLQILDLSGTKVTGDGLVHLKEVAKLQRLALTFTKVTDAGLVHLQGLSRLQELHLSGTKVTADGVRRLQAVLPNCRIGWPGVIPDEQ